MQKARGTCTVQLCPMLLRDGREFHHFPLRAYHHNAHSRRESAKVMERMVKVAMILRHDLITYHSFPCHGIAWPG